MNYRNYIKLKMVFPCKLIVSISLFALLFSSVNLNAQTTLNTTAVSGFTNNNGSGMALFNFQNTNGFPIIITTVEGIVGTAGATTAEVWIRTTPLSGATFTGGVSVSTGWTLAATGTFTGIANTTTTNLTTQVMLTGVSINIPAGVTYGMCVTAYNGTSGRLRYHTMVSPNIPVTTISGGGCNILMGNGSAGTLTNTAFGAASAPPGTTATYNNPRAWLGKLIFAPAAGCTNPIPSPGAATATPSIPVCTGTQVTLALSGSSGGTGQTYQWFSDPSAGGSFTTAVSGVLAVPSFDIFPSSTLYYRCTEICSGGTPANSAPIQVIVNPPFPGGTYTINSSIATGGTNYQTFAAAISAISCGISGPVIFNVDPASGPYTEQVTIPVVGGSSAVNTITFNGNGRTVQFTPVTAARHVLKLDGADFITINNLVIKGLATDFDWGIHLMNGANNNTISNCTIDLNANTSTTQSNSACIVASNSTNAVTTAGNNASNLNITGCTLKGAYQGIILNGLATGLNAVNNIISDNTILDAYGNGIELTQNDGALINGNNISRTTRTIMFSTSAGIEIGLGNRNVTINANRIHDTHTSVITQTGTSYGIYFNACDAPVGSENRVTNNLIYNFNSATGIQYGIYNVGSDGVFYYHNTVVLSNVSSTAGTTYAFHQTTAATNIQFKNNILYVTRGGTGTKNCLRFATVASTIASNNNDLYINSTGGTNGVGFYSVNFPTLIDWQTANGSIWDQQSKSVNPGFVSPGTGLFAPSSVLINDIGENLGVGTDITGAPRSTTPDPGAYEFVPPTLDGAISWVAPVAPVTAGPYTVTVSIFNNQATTITSLDLEYTDGVTPIAENFTGLNIITGQTQNISFTTPYSISGSVSLRAYISLVNGVPDGNQNNDTTVTQNLCISLPAGTYTINSALITGGSNFQTFSAAVSKMVSCGIAGPIVFNILSGSGPYNEQVDIPQIAGSSAINTVTFNCNNVTMSFDATSSTYYSTLNLSGADYMTFNDLNITATGAANAWGIHFMNLSNNNSFNNCTSNVSITSTTTATQALVMNASNTVYSTGGSGGNNNTFNNCTFTGGYYGVVLYGATGGLGNSGNQFIGCSFKESYAYSTYNLYSTNGIIRNCIMERPTRTSTTTAAGVYLSTGCANMLVEKNRIRNMFGGTSTTTGTIYGLYCAIAASAGNENKFYNNLISDINFEGILYGLYFGGASYLKAYHNTVAIDHPSSATSSATYGIYCSGGSSSVDVRNNIVYIKRGGAGTKTCLYYATVPAISNNNDLYNPSPAGSNYIGFNGASYTTLSAWQSASGLDLLSKSIDPLFTNPGTGDFTPTSASMNAYGSNVGITSDITGAPRVPAYPDPGAFEFLVTGFDAAILWVSPVVPGVPGLNPITVSVGNYRTTTITSLDLVYTDGVTLVTESFTGLNIQPSTGQQFTFATPFNLLSSGLLKAYISSVNGISDNDQANDTTPVQKLCIPMNGNYTINSSLPASATNFQSFTTAADALSCGIESPVVFNVSNGPYNEQINIPVIGGASAVNTITFNCFNQTITYDASASSYYATLNLSGADYITFNDLNVVSTGTANAWGIHLMDSSDHNNFNNCNATVSITAAAAVTTVQAVVINGSNTTYSTGGSGGNHNTFTNCTFTGGYYGVVLYGATGAGNGNDGNVFIGCSFRESYSYSTYNLYTTNGILRNCIIERPTRTSTTTATGGYFTTGCAGMLVEKNRVRNMFGGTGTTTGTFYGFACNIAASAGNENVFVNNVISDINFNGTIYGLYFSGGNYIKAYHNTLSLDHTSSTATATTYGVYSTGTTGLDFRNNMITITRGGTGIKYGLYYTGTVTTSNYNDVVVSGAGTNNVGYNGTAYPTMLAWQGATSYDALSISTAPVYADPFNGDFTFTVPSVNNKGIAVGITTDILGAPRNLTTPDIGAFEADFSPIDLGATALVAPVNSGCYSNAETVIIKIKNYGTDPLDFSVTPATVTCNITGTTSATLTGSPSGTLNPGSFMDVTLTSGTVDMSVTGSYTFNAFTTISGDGKASNDNMIAATRSKVVLVAGTASSNLTYYCVSGTPTLTLTGNAGSNIQWQSSTFSSTGPWTNAGTGANTYIPSSPITQITYIRALATCQATSDSSNAVTIDINNPQPLTTTGATRCGIGSVTLQATAPGGASLNWYAALTGGSSLGTSTSFITPTIPSTTNFYVSVTNGAGSGTAGRITPFATSTGFSGNDYGLVFDATTAFTLYSVDVFPTTASGVLTIQLKNSSGTVLQSAGPFNIPAATGTTYGGGATPVTLAVNFNVPVGTGFWIQSAAHTGSIIRDNPIGANFTFPLPIGTVGNITAGLLAGAANANTYYYFYNWQFSSGCEGSRVPVTATVTPSPALGIAAGTTTLCQGTSTTLSVGTGLSDYNSFGWSPATGLSATTGTSVTATPSVTTKYYLGALNSSNGCQAVDSITIVVNSVNLNLLVDNPLVCNNGTAQVNASVGAGSFTYNWSPAIGLSSSTIANPVVTPPAASTTYTVSVSDLNTGCTKSGTVTIIKSDPQVISSSVNNRCGPGPVTFQASGTPGQVNWWSASTGGTLIATSSPYIANISANTTYYAAIKDAIPQTPVSTGFGGATTATDPNAAGNMFNVVALHDLTITGFDIHLNNNGALAPSNISVYYKAGTYIGFNNNAAAWTLAGSVTGLTSSGNGVPTTLPLTLAINIPAGQTYGIYIVVTNLGVANSLRYLSSANSPAEGAVAASDYNLQVTSGTVSFGPFTGVPGAPINRLWNGRVKYSIGCESARTAVTATVTTPPSINITGTPPICQGDSATISVTSPNDPDYTYTWNPGGLAGSSIKVSPASSTTYTVTAVDNSSGSDSGCINIGTYALTVFPAPVISSMQASPNLICGGGTPITLTALTGTSVPGVANIGTQTATIGGSNGNPYRTGNGVGNQVHTQLLVLASELTAGGLSAGNLTSLGFTTTGAAGTVVNFTIKIGHTALSTLTTSFVTTPMTTVFTQASFAPVLGLNTHLFSTPFIWDGISNIIVDVCQQNSVIGTTTVAVYTPGYASNTHVGAVGGCSAATGSAVANKPIMKFGGSFGTSGPGSYLWQWSPGTLPPGNEVITTPAATTMFTVTATDNVTGCFSKSSILVNVTPAPQPNMQEGDSVLCSNDAGFYMHVLDGGAYGGGYPAGTIFNFYGAGAILYQSGTDNTFFNANNSDAFYAIVTLPGSIGGCEGVSDTAVMDFSNSQAPQYVLTTDSVRCYGESNGKAMAEIIFGGTPRFRWQWYNSSHSLIRDVTSTSLSDTLSGMPEGMYTIVITDHQDSLTSPYCSITDSVFIGQPEAPLSVSENTGNHVNVLCFGGATGAIDINAGGGTSSYSYNWSNGASTQDLSGIAAGTYACTVTDSRGCTAVISIAVTQGAPLVVTITGNPGICTGSTSILNAGGGYSSYLWSTGATTQTISVSAAGTYTVTVTNANGCTGTASVTTVINPKPVPTISGINTVCTISTTVINAGAGFSAYLWSTGATTQSVTVPGGTYTVTVTNSFGCTGTATKVITITPSVPAQPGIITGPSAVCKNSNATFSIATVPGATGYTWTAGSGATVSTGQGSTTVVVNFSNAATSATLTVVATNVCGSSVVRTLSYTVSSAIPATPITITGQLTGVCGQTLSYTCPVVPNATSYQWSVPANATIMSGQGTNTVSVKFNATFTSTGSLSVYAQSGCGNSTAISKTIDAKPQMPVISGSNFACQYQAGVGYSVTPVYGATSYIWTVVAGSTLVSGQGTTSIVVNWGAINGVITCKASDGCGNSLPGSKPVSFTCKEEGSLFEFSEINLYPNPASTSATIQFDAFTDGEGLLQVYDMIGQQMLQEDLKVSSGNNQYNIDLNTYPKGTYIVKFIYKGFTRNCKLIVK